MFQPFVQAGTDRSGLGLRLSISRRSVAANDGFLSVRDVPGSGCVFTIELPAAPFVGRSFGIRTTGVEAERAFI